MRSLSVCADGLFSWTKERRPGSADPGRSACLVFSKDDLVVDEVFLGRCFNQCQTAILVGTEHHYFAHFAVTVGAHIAEGAIASVRADQLFEKTSIDFRDA